MCPPASGPRQLKRSALMERDQIEIVTMTSGLTIRNITLFCQASEEFAGNLSQPSDSHLL